MTKGPSTVSSVIVEATSHLPSTQTREPGRRVDTYTQIVRVTAGSCIIEFTEHEG